MSGTPPTKPTQVAQAVAQLARPLACKRGLAIWDVIYRKEAGRDLLRVLIDRPGPSGIDSGELTKFSEVLSTSLDSDEVIAVGQEYLLEVTSPGGERKLHGSRQFEICRGRAVRINLRDERKAVEGKITGVDETSVEIDSSDRIQLARISMARLIAPRA